MAKIFYGSELQDIECARLRIKDIDFGLNQIIIRGGKGQKDRITMLPDEVKPAFNEHLKFVKKLHEKDLSEWFGRVHLPHALTKKYKNADRHSFATHLLQDGYNIRIVQELLEN